MWLRKQLGETKGLSAIYRHHAMPLKPLRGSGLIAFSFFFLFFLVLMVLIEKILVIYLGRHHHHHNHHNQFTIKKSTRLGAGILETLNRNFHGSNFLVTF